MSRYAWETQDGQKWLAKALDPAGMQSVDVKGLPDQESTNVVVLNYQSQYEVSPPNMFGVSGNDASTYETELFLFQDPIVYGTAASYPTGTMDPMHDSKEIEIHFGSTFTNSAGTPAITKVLPQIKFKSTGTLFPRTCKRFINSQLNNAKDIGQAYAALRSVAQRHRMIYGAAQLIPTCSYQDNSGTISVSQQPFVGDDHNHAVMDAWSGVDDLTSIATLTAKNESKDKFSTKIYLPNDFPDTEDNIRNPASLLTRFYEGAYIPYKLKNPFQEDFINTSDAVTTIAPFWVIGASYMPVGQTTYSPMDWDMASKSFTTPMAAGGGAREYCTCIRLKLTLMSRTGAIKEIVFVQNDATAVEGTTLDYHATYNFLASDILSGVLNQRDLLADCNSQVYKLDMYVQVGTGSPAVYTDTKKTEKLLCYRAGVYDALTGTNEDVPRARMPSSNIAACLCKAMNMKGNITLLFRMGLEIVVTGSSTYSPFNHRSPAYDESAIKSYLRVMHGMSDAFYGNSATDYFHNAYYNYIIGQLYQPDVTVDYANRGSYWRGVVSAKY